MMNIKQTEAAIEAILFASGEPISVKRLADTVPDFESSLNISHGQKVVFCFTHKKLLSALRAKVYSFFEVHC